MIKDKSTSTPEYNEVKSREQAIAKLKKEKAKIKRETESFARKVRSSTAHIK